MNKSDLISKVAEDTGLSKVDTGKALDSIIDAIEGALKKGDKVTLVGFGTFSISQRKARKGINPRTKQEIKIPAKKVVKFKPGKNLSV